MPSTSVSAKVDKQQSSTVVAPAQNAAAPTAEAAAVAAAAAAAAAAANAVDNSTPIRQVLVIIEHKIRNLEKRKSKLETYRDMEKAGKELNGDMKVAVAKYGEVAQTLEFARDFAKQILQIAIVSEKDLKKKQKKDETAKKQGDISRIREVLIMQNLLGLLGGDNDADVRQDFLLERNGACKLEPSELDLMDAFYAEVTPGRPEHANETPFKTAAQRAADHLSAAVESKPKPFGNETATYEDVRNVLKNIQKCGYFDQATVPSATAEPEAAAAPSAGDAVVEQLACEPDAPATEVTMPAASSVRPPQHQHQPTTPKTTHVAVAPVAQSGFAAPATVSPGLGEPKTTDYQQAPSAAAVPAPTFPPQPLQASAPVAVATVVNAAAAGVAPLNHVQLHHHQIVPEVLPTAVANLPPSPQQQQQLEQRVAATTVVPDTPTAAVAPARTALPVAAVGRPLIGVPVVGVPVAGAAAVQPQHANVLHMAPQTVRAVEQAYFKQQQQQQQQQQFITQMRPLAEVINAQHFYFLQESELDNPDVTLPLSPPQQPQPAIGVFASQISPPAQQQQQHLHLQQSQTLSPSQAHLLLQQQQQQSNQLLQQQQQQHLAANRQPPPQQQQQQPPPAQATPFVGNASFANGAMFTGALKPSDLQQIAGFAGTNAPITITPLINQQQQQHLAQSVVGNLLQHDVSKHQQQQLPTFPSQPQHQTHLNAGFMPLPAANGSTLTAALAGANSPLTGHSLLMDGASRNGNQLNGATGHHSNQHQHGHQQQQHQHHRGSAAAAMNNPGAASPAAAPLLAASLVDTNNRVPEITEWQPEDAAQSAPAAAAPATVVEQLQSNEWQSATTAAAANASVDVGTSSSGKFYANNIEPDVGDWNDDSSLSVVGGVGSAVVAKGASGTSSSGGDDSNAWSGQQQHQRFPYNRGNNGNYGRGGSGNQNRGGNAAGGLRAGGGDGGRQNTQGSVDVSTATNGNSNSNGGNVGYNRNRNAAGNGGNSFQQNGVAGGGNAARSGASQQQQQQQPSQSQSSTFYRNNESFYQNGAGGNAGYRSGAGAGDKGNNNSGGGGYRDNKNDGGFRSGGGGGGGNNNYRSREAANNGIGVGAVRSGGRANNRYQSDSAERGQSSGSRPAQQQPGHVSETSPTLGVGQPQQQQTGGRPMATATKHTSVYGGGPRPSGAGHNRQGVNV